MPEKEWTNPEILQHQQENRKQILQMMQEKLERYPALKKLAQYFQQLEWNEQEEIFVAFDETEFLAYDLFGAIWQGDLKV